MDDDDDLHNDMMLVDSYVLISYSHTIVTYMYYVTKQYNLVLAKWRGNALRLGN